MYWFGSDCWRVFALGGGFVGMVCGGDGLGLTQMAFLWNAYGKQQKRLIAKAF
jgi:hypothetical protein